MGKIPSAIIATVFVGAGAAAFFWLASQPLADADPAASSVAATRDRIGMTAIGCQSLHTFQRMTTLITGPETAASVAEFNRNMASGECVELDKGETVQYVASIGTTNMKVRPEGDATAYWTFWAIVDQR